MELVLCLLFPVLVVVVIVVVWWISVSNNFKRKETKVYEGLSNIEVALEKRYDMLTKLRDAAKAYLTHETEVFSKVIELRKGMSVAELSAADAAMTTYRDGLFAVAENYPDLRSSDVFVQLERGIHDAEDHLQAARRLFNSNVSAYNQAIIVFPSSIIANVEKRSQKTFYEVADHKRQDVEIRF
ncbi:MAG: LemA family protein [Coriobacteriales bacterium]|jgi:LemA protein|nr:LemA family protein [Coriobacteriales bacterium]